MPPPSGAYAYVAHRTAGELKAKAVKDNVNRTCHVCGIAPLSIDELKKILLIESYCIITVL